MYSFKEKNKILRELNNSAYGEADLNLLLHLDPGCKISSSVKNNPKKHSEEILFKLLDKATREEIRLNRRKFDGQDNDIPNDDGIPDGPDGQDNDIHNDDGTPIGTDGQDNDIPGNDGGTTGTDGQGSDIPGNDDGTPTEPDGQDNDGGTPAGTAGEKKSDKKKTSTQKSSGTTSVKTETSKSQL